MYIVVLLASIGAGIWLIVSGAERQRQSRILAGLGVILGIVGLYALMSFWGELLWFESLGYDGRFWTEVWVRVGLAVFGAAAAYALAGQDSCRCGVR